VEPASGAAQDFSVPVTYTVRAVDGSARIYTVTVTILGQGSISVTFNGPGDENTTLEAVGITDNKLSWDMGLTLTVPPGNFTGAAYRWYKDGTEISNGTTNSLTIPGSTFTLAPHQIMVRITTSTGVVYSKTISFIVE
jgi:hypothetical protein